MVDKKQFFGTDGVRGQANTGKMTPDMVMRLGMAAGKIFRNGGTRRHSVVIGKDTRLSGYMIEPALVAGFTAVGMDVKLFGPIPTPAVSLMTRTLRADLGVMITASHNKYEDNGIKFFGPDGRKLHDDTEHAIEALLQGPPNDSLVSPKNLGRVKRYEDVQARYIEIVKSTFPRRMRLSNMRIVVDCANGAAYKTAPDTLWELGAEKVIPIGISPDGTNINEGCGSTSTQLLSDTVLEMRADIGIALDGDADRLIMCDEKGNIIDGDQLLALMATGWKASGQLAQQGIVATIMSNLGLERFLQSEDLSLVRTAVGDRYVAETMRSQGYNLGGEQSGHMLMTDFSPTGDGTMAALQVLAEIVRSGKPASEVLNLFDPVPQRLKNVRFSGVSPMTDKTVLSAIEDARSDLGKSGRILVRPSGTEPLIRVMAEGDDVAKVENITNDLVEIIRNAAA